MDLQRWHLWYKHRGGRDLREILLREWDPIGIAGHPDARDEYDMYLADIAQRLRSDADEQDVVALLEWARCDRMGLPPNPEADKRVAKALRQWYATEMRRAVADQ